MQLLVLLLDDETPAVGGAADHVLPLPPSHLLLLLLPRNLARGPAGLVESNPALVAANHQHVGGVDVAEVDLPALLDVGEALVCGVLEEAGWLLAADIVSPGMSNKVGVEELELLPGQFNHTHNHCNQAWSELT